MDELRRTLESWKPNVVYLQGQPLPNVEVGSLVWDGVDLSNAEAISELFNHVVPTTVCFFELMYDGCGLLTGKLELQNSCFGCLCLVCCIVTV